MTETPDLPRGSETAVPTFEKVTLSQPGRQPVAGTLVAHPDRLEFRSKAGTVSMPDVREVTFELEKVNPGDLQRTARVRVTHGTGEDLTTTYLFKLAVGRPKKIQEANRQLAVALQGVYGTAALSEAERQKVASSVSVAKLRNVDAQIRGARIRMWVSGAVAVIGLLVTLISYSVASAGGSYVIAWGAMVFGTLFFLISLFEYRSGIRTKRESSQT